ncbi:hypothetical protein INT46_001761 [Mucor plumbeus]|uniref:Uncharacterized protein n=1 Tax=Mucor plumbeus TaxID=97098 RepID=A0A8H7RA20_9FUNG|nr:hypothetical protein INT46_001761 [Mucor plumbeus]
MLSNNHSFRKLHLLGGKRSKVEPITLNSASANGNVSMDDLAFLVKRLSVQIDDLETWKEKESAKNKQTSESIPKPQQQPLLPPLPQENQYQHYNHKKDNKPKRPPTHTTIDPWASYVPQNYGALLQRLEDIESLQKCPNECCAGTGTVSSADGVPWPAPIEPFQTTNSSSFIGSSQQSLNDMLDTQYTHWCTVMRCLPLMDPVTCAHVKTVGLYAMREILKLKANQKRDLDHHYSLQLQSQQQQTCCNSTIATTTKLRESLSCLSDKSLPIKTITPAHQDMPAWMSTSETKTAIAELVPPPSVPPKETETTTTPTPSGFPSPTLLTRRRFQKWVKYKKSQRKAHTDTTSTPMAQSQTLKKIGSWFF